MADDGTSSSAIGQPPQPAAIAADRERDDREVDGQPGEAERAGSKAPRGSSGLSAWA